MTILRQKMTDKMILCGLASRTQESYLYAVFKIAKYYARSPDLLTYAEVEDWFLHLIKVKGLSPSTIRLYLNGLVFLYREVLGRDKFLIDLPIPRKQQKIPELLSRAEVSAIIQATSNLKGRALLTVCYGCGLRVSELAHISISHIDGKQNLLRIPQSKGNKDRNVPLPDSVYKVMRAYWKDYRPKVYLFEGDAPHSLGISSIQKTYTRAKAAANIQKVGGIHALRHAFATHQIERGMPIGQLKDILGHSCLSTTLRYYHWLPSQQVKSFDVVAQLEGDDDE